MTRLHMRLVAASAFALLQVAATPALSQSPATHQHTFSGAEQWAEMFDDPTRDEWQKPHEVIQALGLGPKAKVADIGAGTGYFAVRLAHFVPQGHVYGVDTEPEMVKYLSERARRDGLNNLTAIVGAPDDPRLPEKVDVALLVDVYHHLSDPERYFRNLRGVLNPDGRVVIIDFDKRSPIGPPPGERPSPEEIEAAMAKAGYKLVKSNTFLPNQYYLVFQRGGA